MRFEGERDGEGRLDGDDGWVRSATRPVRGLFWRAVTSERAVRTRFFEDDGVGKIVAEDEAAPFGVEVVFLTRRTSVLSSEVCFFDVVVADLSLVGFPALEGPA